MTVKAAYYLTTPIYYVNDSPHIGHAYTSLACDVLARFMRLDGHEVFFLTGTDEHGQKVEKSAAAAGRPPKEFVDEVSERFRALTKLMNFSNDDFIRTTEERHIRSCQELWRRIAANKSPKGRDNIYLDTYGGWYSVRDEAFFGEAELIKGADGEKLAPSGAPVEWVEEPSYFFRLEDWRERLLEYYALRDGTVVAPESRRNEVESFVKGELFDLSISRTSFSWGIPVPGDDAHIMYVWLDALTNYITAIGFPDEDSARYKTFWPASLHMVGKDILRFHTVYWPAFLMAAGLEPPERVFAHGWWTNEGEKISKSLGNVIDPADIVAQFGLDQVRYFLLREVPFGNDGDFSRRAMVGRINSELANDFGNLAQRVLSMMHKNCDAQMPQPGALRDADKVLLSSAEKLIDTVRVEIGENQAFHEALTQIWAVVRQANGYIAEQEPWVLRKTDPERMATVLYVAAECIRHLATICQPFMPDSCATMLDQLGAPQEGRDFTSLGPDGALVPGTGLPKPEPVFPRFVEDAPADG
ncbi:MAG: Methionine--tRNA ligase [Alphaproteobacteria bacterium MarineAlpha10_Bin1]|nr:MAG: Methionine--tRNA ligase [Alphaproteobacteria bacterium MarineAlpha10_Bin1]